MKISVCPEKKPEGDAGVFDVGQVKDVGNDGNALAEAHFAAHDGFAPLIDPEQEYSQ